MIRKSSYLKPADSKNLVYLLNASLSDYLRNGGRKIDWLKKIGISTRTWYKWASQDAPRIRKITSVKITKLADLDTSELPEIISESLNPTIFLNKSFKGYLANYLESNLITSNEKLFLLVGLFASLSVEVGINLKVSLKTDNSSGIVIEEKTNSCITITTDKVPAFELVCDAVCLCRGVLDYDNIKILIKWLHKRIKSTKTKNTKTLHEQYRSTFK